MPHHHKSSEKKPERKHSHHAKSKHVKSYPSKTHHHPRGKLFSHVPRVAAGLPVNPQITAYQPTVTIQSGPPNVTYHSQNFKANGQANPSALTGTIVLTFPGPQSYSGPIVLSFSPGPLAFGTVCLTTPTIGNHSNYTVAGGVPTPINVKQSASSVNPSDLQTSFTVNGWAPGVPLTVNINMSYFCANPAA